MREKGLTRAELAEGVGRLNARAFAADGMETLNSFTGTFVHESAAPASRALEAQGLDWETAGAVVDLALALLASRLTAEEVLRLGTSEEALTLFETRSSEWQKVLRRRAEDASENVVRFRSRTV